MPRWSPGRYCVSILPGQSSSTRRVVRLRKLDFFGEDLLLWGCDQMRYRPIESEIKLLKWSQSITWININSLTSTRFTWTSYLSRLLTRALNKRRLDKVNVPFPKTLLYNIAADTHFHFHFHSLGYYVTRIPLTVGLSFYSSSKQISSFCGSSTDL